MFLVHSERHNSPDADQWDRRFLQNFAGIYPGLLVRDLKPFHVTKWIDARPGWSTARWNAITAGSGLPIGPRTR